MPRVNGLLSLVTDQPEAITEAIVRAPHPRVHGDGVVTVSPVTVRVEGGVFDAVLAPGPCVLTLLSGGVPVCPVKLLVPDGDVSLRAAFQAAFAAEGGDRSVLEQLAAEAAQAVESAAASASAASGSAAAASASASAAAGSADAAASSESNAKASELRAVAAADDAGRAETAAAQSADAAASSSESAGASATQAARSADQADRIASSTSWSGDRLTVNGQTSPPLTGPQGPKGEPGQAGRDGVDGRDGVRDVRALSGYPGHTALPAPGTIAQRDTDGSLKAMGFGYDDDDVDSVAEIITAKTAAEMADPYRVTTRLDVWGFISIAAKEMLAEAQAFARLRPAFFSGAGAPPASIPGAVVGDYYLNETTMELHKITGV